MTAPEPEQRREDGPPRGWCPECDGPSRCAPGTCCGVGAPKADRGIHAELDIVQARARELGFCCYAAAIAPDGPCPWHAPEAPIPAVRQISAEDVRAAFDAWWALPETERKDRIDTIAHAYTEFAAEFLNRRGEELR